MNVIPISRLLAACAIIVSLVAALPAHAQSPQDAFESGYQQGYQAENPRRVPPVTPIAPIPPLGQTYYDEGLRKGMERGIRDKGQDYQSGYDEGYQKGHDDAAPADENGDDSE